MKDNLFGLIKVVAQARNQQAGWHGSPDPGGTGTAGYGQGVGGGVLPGWCLLATLPLPSQLLNIYPTQSTIRKLF